MAKRKKRFFVRRYEKSYTIEDRSETGAWAGLHRFTRAEVEVVVGALNAAEEAKNEQKAKPFCR